MGKTIVEKILSRAAAEDAYAGDIVNTSISYLMTNDAVGELTIEAFGMRSIVSKLLSISTRLVLKFHVPGQSIASFL
jgi:homoaconitase/3-isopropylmalate dehydratase large subunit